MEPIHNYNSTDGDVPLFARLFTNARHQRKATFIQRYDFRRVSALKLEKNTVDPNDMSMKYSIHPEQLKQVPLATMKEHPDFVSTTKATYRPFQFQTGGKPAVAGNGGKGGEVDQYNTGLFLPDYAHTDNKVSYRLTAGVEILRLLQGKRAREQDGELSSQELGRLLLLD